MINREYGVNGNYGISLTGGRKILPKKNKMYKDATNYIMGGNNAWTLNSIGSVSGNLKGTYQIIYIGRYYLNTPSFIYLVT